MIDISDYTILQKENRGVHPNKVWMITPEICQGKNRIALFKETEYRRDGSSMLSHFAEMIYSDISNELLEFPCAKIQRVTYNGKTGVLSYNILDGLPNNNADNSRYILQDMAPIITLIEPDFDMETLQVRGKKEYYSIEMILKAFKNAANSEEEYRKLESFLINLCLVDSITNSNDRHAMNLSVGYDNITGGIFPVAVYDNGGCLGLGVPQDQVERAVNKKEDAKKIRGSIFSKIGVLESTPISFDLLETLIFNHYYEIARPMAQKINSSLLPERIDEILSREDYSDMPEVYKTFVKNQIEFNRQEMQKRLAKSKFRYEIEQLIDEEKALDAYMEKFYSLSGTEFKSKEEALSTVIASVFSTDDVKINSQILSNEDFCILKEIENSPEAFCDGKVICLEHDKNIAKWSLIYNRLLNSMDKNIPEDVRKARLNELFITKMNFYKQDIEEINILSKVYEMNHEKPERETIRQFIKGKNGIGDERVDSYLILQHAKSVVQKSGMEEVEHFEKTYIDILEKEQIIDAYLGKKDTRFNFIKDAGVSDEEEIYKLIYFSIDKIKEKNRHFTSKEAFEKYIIEQAKFFEKGKYDVIDGLIVSKEDQKTIRNNTYTLPNGEKAVILDRQISGLNNIAFNMGLEHAIQIKEIDDKGNYTILIAHNRGDTKFPDELERALGIAEEKAKESLGDMRARKIIKRVKSKKEGSKVGELLSYTGNLKKGLEENILLLYDEKARVDAKVIDEDLKKKMTQKIKNYIFTLYGRKDRVKENDEVEK